MKKMAMGVAAVWVAVAVGLLVPPNLRAQDTAKMPEPTTTPVEHYYRLDFVVQELTEAGTVNNSRRYVALLETGSSGQQIRTGSRIPVATGAGNMSTQIQYVDVGVNFDVRQAREVGDKLRFNVKAEISSIADDNSGGASGHLVGDPVIRQNRWDSVVLIPVGKPTVVFSADDLDSKGKMQVELTATKVE